MALRNTNVADRPVDLHSQGFSHSSREHLIDEAERWRRMNARPFAFDDVARQALARERENSPIAIAAQDVYSIARGGVVEITTLAGGGIFSEPIQHDPRWIAEHVIIGVKLNGGEQHDSPTLLRDLVDHPDAGRYVRRISLEAGLAAEAIRHADHVALASAVNAYRRFFDEWSAHRYISPTVADLAKRMQRILGKVLLGWKLPGAGGCSSIIVITTDIESVSTYLADAGWFATPATVTDGLRCEEFAEGGLMRVSAGYRIDFVGAADLGQDPRISEDGLCVSAAIEPRAERVFAALSPEGLIVASS